MEQLIEGWICDGRTVGGREGWIALLPILTEICSLPDRFATPPIMHRLGISCFIPAYRPTFHSTITVLTATH